MAVALRVICLIGIFTLSACYKTELPSYSYSKPGHSKSKQVKSSYSKKKASRGYSTYRVRKGDTLYSIGKRFGVDHKLLATRNHVRYPYTIYVGQQLSLTRTAAKPQYLPIPKARVKGKRSIKKSTRSTKKITHRKKAVNGSVKLRWPLKATVTSRFGRRGSRMHDGIDIGAKEGTPIRAAAAGEVVYSDQRLSGYGKLIIIRHSSDMFTAYAHNQRNLVRKGNRVKSGDVIARVGKTGRASGPHLHFEVRRGPTPVDPMAYLPRR